MRKVILAIRDFNDLSSLREKRLFWNSFINLQKNLPSNIQVRFILQHYKGKESKLYSFLFEPFLEFNLNIENIAIDIKTYKKYNSFKGNIINQLNLALKESYCISSISSYFANKKNKYKFDQLILLNYKLTNLNYSKSLFIYDNLLPLKKIYLIYSDYIDQGYPTNLIIIPKQFLEIFSQFNEFFLSLISSNSNFLNQYNISRWRLFLRKKTIKEFLFISKNYFKNIIKKFLKLIENNILKFINIRILRFILSKVKIILNTPNLTKENSFLDESINQGISYFRNILLLQPILKYFINENFLRKETRFISHEDFENYNDPYIIGRKDFILVLNDDFSLNEKIIKSELNKLKLKPKFTLFVKKNKVILYEYFQTSGRFLKEIYFKGRKNEYQNILSVLFKLKNNNKFNYNPPILILNSLLSFASCTDFSYLNALLQFFIWEDISYVSFINTNSRIKYSAFPYLYSISKKHKLNLERCIINFKLLQELKYSICFKNENYNDILVLNNKKKLFI